jgi:hypothetical protein
MNIGTEVFQSSPGAALLQCLLEPDVLLQCSLETVRSECITVNVLQCSVESPVLHLCLEANVLQC